MLAGAVLDMAVECARFCGKCPEDRGVLFAEPCPACQQNGGYPYFCSQAAAERASPVRSAHRDNASAPEWMPDGVPSWHSAFDGSAATCLCDVAACSAEMLHDSAISNASNGGLGGGAVAGIVLGAVVAAMAVAMLLWKVLRTKSAARPIWSVPSNKENATKAAPGEAHVGTEVSAVPAAVEVL